METAVVYFSKTGRTRRAAELVAEGMRTVPGCEARLLTVEEADAENLARCRAVVFGTPTYYASFSWQMKKWLDESWGCSLAGKLGAVFATADYPEGGADTALLGLAGHLMVKGMLVYSGGSALGQPYLHLGAVAFTGAAQEGGQKLRIFGRRVAEKAVELFGDQ